jgi:hypothetical protein
MCTKAHATRSCYYSRAGRAPAHPAAAGSQLRFRGAAARRGGGVPPLALPKGGRVRKRLLDVRVGPALGLVVAVRVVAAPTASPRDRRLDLRALPPLVVAGDRHHIGALRDRALPETPIVLPVRCNEVSATRQPPRNRTRAPHRRTDAVRGSNAPQRGSPLGVGHSAIHPSGHMDTGSVGGLHTSWLCVVGVPGPDPLVTVARTNLMMSMRRLHQSMRLRRVLGISWQMLVFFLCRS